MFGKKHRLIILIIASMLIGIIVGYVINTSITNNAIKIEQSYIKQSAKGNTQIET